MASGTGIANIKHEITLNYENLLDVLTEFLADMASEYVASEFDVDTEVNETWDCNAEIYGYTDKPFRWEGYEATRYEPAEFSTSIDDEIDIEPDGEGFSNYLINNVTKDMLVEFIQNNADKFDFKVGTVVDYGKEY